MSASEIVDLVQDSPCQKIETFVVVGPQRTGTSWIYDFLSNHPDVNTTKNVKELRFFGRESNNNIEWYQRQFTRNGIVNVEVSSEYFDSEDAIEDISSSTVSGIFICYRDPVDRIMSLHRHLVNMSGSIKVPGQSENNESNYVESSLYHKHTRSWDVALGADRVHILDFAELSADPAAVGRHICRVIGVPFSENALPSGRVNAGRQVKFPLLYSLLVKLKRFIRQLGMLELVSRVKKSYVGRFIKGTLIVEENDPDSNVMNEIDLETFVREIEADHMGFLKYRKETRR